MQKYLQIIRGVWQEYFIYRLGFVMWRLRVIIQLLITYFLWLALLKNDTQLFGYTQNLILTYILLTSLVRATILATRTFDVGSIINNGELSNYILKPVNFFKVFWMRDLGDKSINIVFAIGELFLLYIVLQPPIFIQTSPFILFFTFVSLFIGMILFFYFSLVLSFLGFWTPDVWSPRFLSLVLIEFFAGGLFPLDILPKPLFVLSQSLPFSYFIYFPIKVYLGQLNPAQMIQGLTIGLLWIGGLWWLAVLFWQRGIKVYTAEGR